MSFLHFFFLTVLAKSRHTQTPSHLVQCYFKDKRPHHDAIKERPQLSSYLILQLYWQGYQQQNCLFVLFCSSSFFDFNSYFGIFGSFLGGGKVRNYAPKKNNKMNLVSGVYIERIITGLSQWASVLIPWLIHGNTWQALQGEGSPPPASTHECVRRKKRSKTSVTHQLVVGRWNASWRHLKVKTQVLSFNLQQRRRSGEKQQMENLFPQHMSTDRMVKTLFSFSCIFNVDKKELADDKVFQTVTRSIFCFGQTPFAMDLELFSLAGVVLDLRMK